MNFASTRRAHAESEWVQVEIARLRLASHARGVPVAVLASALAALLLVLALGGTLAAPRLWAWLGALACALSLRALLWRAHRYAPVDVVRRPVWISRYRAVIALHGLAWGGLAWLLPALDEPQQAVLVFVLNGLVVGAMALTLFDLAAALWFVGASWLPLLLRLVLMPQPLSQTTWVVCAMALLLVGLLIAAARRSQQEREALVVTRQAQAASAEQAQAAQALSHQIFDHVGQGITVFDADQRLRAWNALTLSNTGLDAALARLGLPLREALLSLAQGGEFGGVDPEAEADRRLAVLTGPLASVTRHFRPDGRCIETRSNPLPDGGLVLMHVDISEREASQAVLAEQQRKLALVLENTEQGFWTIDNALLTTDANPAICRMLGVSRAQLLGRSIYDFVDPANADIFRHQARLRAQGQTAGYEIALRRADGTLVYCFNNATPVFDDRGRKTGALGLFSDISVQKRAQQQSRRAGEQLAQKSQVLAATLDNLVQGVLSVDEQGRCNTWNRRFIELLQLPESLMQGRPTLDELRQFQAARGDFGERLERMDAAGQQNLQSFVQADLSTLAGRYQRTRADGLVLEVASYFAADGSLLRTYTDVTAAVQAQQALRAAKDEAVQAREEAERANRAKSDFLSRMSHELRTPMNAILGFGQLLEADVDAPLSPVQRQRVTQMLRGGHHLLVLINEVLDIARIEAGTLQLVLQPVDAAALARDCLSLVQPVAQARRVSLVLVEPGAADDAGADAGADTLLALADATRLRQVLLNLLSNAIKFNRLAGQVRLSCRAEAGAVLIEVSDQGPGIAPEQLPRLFQAFERLDVDVAIEGAGIGLALSRSLVALMHGEIGVRSTPGQGSVFWLRLPASSRPSAVPKPSEVVGVPAVPGRRQSVLYIEDNEVNQLLMEGMLGHRPALVLRLAGLPEEGLLMAATEPPDLVLLDIQLPGMDGFEVLRRLRELPALRAVPVVAVSANARVSDLEDAQRAGFADYLTKPLHLPRLLALVDRMLAGPPA